MVLSGEQWLDRVFRPTVAAATRFRSEGMAPGDALRLMGDRLAAQVEALGQTGVLSDEQERAARDALEEAGIAPEVRSVSFSASSRSVVAPTAVRVGSAPVIARKPAEPPVLRGVLAGPRPFGHLDGRPVTLVSVELWSDHLLIDLYTDPGPEHREQRKRHTRTRLEWVRSELRGLAPKGPAPRGLASPLQEFTWRLSDAHGTEYYRSGGTAEAHEHLDRQRLRWSPAPLPTVDHLTLHATDPTGAAAFTATIDLSAE
jgi:hypothetical protein